MNVRQSSRSFGRSASLACCLFCVFGFSLAERAVAEHPGPLAVANAAAASESQMQPYAEEIEHTSVKIEMTPIPGGSFLMGSPESEAGRSEDEGPQHEVRLSPFWMSECEITWDAYEVWMSDMDIVRREALGLEPTVRDEAAEKYQLSQPTPPYTDMTFGMGKQGYPAICMTQHAARTFCKWLTEKTGRYYRLPTEAEWEYACRAGTTSAYHFGEDSDRLDQYAWYASNSDDRYRKVGQKEPNAWGLYDMHGNVAEWVLDQYVPDAYRQHRERVVANPLVIPETLYPRVVRGGSWDDDAVGLRSAARAASNEDWKAQDPQIPQSIWYHTDAVHVGFRVVRPLNEPASEERAAKWDRSEPPQRDLD